MDHRDPGGGPYHGVELVEHQRFERAKDVAQETGSARPPDVSCPMSQRDARQAKPGLRCAAMAWAVPIGPWRLPRRFVPTPPSLSCCVKASRPQGATGARAVAPSRQPLRRAAPWCWRHGPVRSGLTRALIGASNEGVQLSV